MAGSWRVGIPSRFRSARSQQRVFIVYEPCETVQSAPHARPRWPSRIMILIARATAHASMLFHAPCLSIPLPSSHLPTSIHPQAQRRVRSNWFVRRQTSRVRVVYPPIPHRRCHVCSLAVGRWWRTPRAPAWLGSSPLPSSVARPRRRLPLDCLTCRSPCPVPRRSAHAPPAPHSLTHALTSCHV